MSFKRIDDFEIIKKSMFTYIIYKPEYSNIIVFKCIENYNYVFEAIKRYSFGLKEQAIKWVKQQEE